MTDDDHECPWCKLDAAIDQLAERDADLSLARHDYATLLERWREEQQHVLHWRTRAESAESRLGAVEDELRHSVSVISIVRSWLMENVRGSTHWENCEREHATCRAISQLGGVVERLSRLNLTAAGRESLQNVPQIGPGRIPQT